MASKLTCWTGLSWSFGFTNSVTPKFLAVKEIKNQNHRQHVNRNIYLCIPLMTHPYRNEQGSDQHQWFLKPQPSLLLHKPKYQYKIRDLEILSNPLAFARNYRTQQQRKLTARPTAPNPKTATVWPFWGFATFKVAPMPTSTKTNRPMENNKKIVGILSLI